VLAALALAADTARRPRERLKALGCDWLLAVVACPVGVFLELVESPAEVNCDVGQLTGRDRAGHLQDGVRGVVAGALAELHLDARSPNRFGKLGQLSF
jgi:hypothetical protein